jgi:hypothetical protein
MRDGGRSIGIADFDKLAQVPSCLFPTPYIFKWFLQRFVTLGNMPADLPNIEKLVEYETQKHGERRVLQRRQRLDAVTQECLNG